MKKLGWYAFSAAVAVFVAAGLVLLAANLYVQSHGVQQRIREALEASLKLPVALRKTTLTPWEGLRLDGITLRSPVPEAQTKPAAPGPTDFLTAASFRVRFAWWPLIFHGRTEITEVLLDRPHLTWAQEAEGKWTMPSDKETAREAKAAIRHKPKSSPAAPAAAASPPDVAEEVVQSALPSPPAILEKNPGAASTPEPFAIEKVRLRHGVAEFLDSRHRPVGKIEEINLDGRVNTGDQSAGTLEFDRASAPCVSFALANYHTEFTYADSAGLDLRDGRGQLAGGELRTSLHVNPAQPGSPFSASLRLEKISLAQLVRPLGGPAPLMEGRLHGRVDCAGSINDPATLDGSGRIWLENARVRDIPLLSMLGQILRIQDLSEMQFKQAEINYRLVGPVLKVDSVALSSNDLRVVARGDYDIEADRLNIHAKLLIDEAVGHQLPQFIENNFAACGAEAPDLRYLDFDVTGSVKNPKSNLTERLMNGPMKGLFDNLFAPKTKAPKVKNHHHDEMPAGSPPVADVP